MKFSSSILLHKNLKGFPNWKNLYEDLLNQLNEKLSKKAKKQVFFELIFMTYSYVHRMINNEAFPMAINLYNPEIMTGRGMGKYAYKQTIREEGEKYMKEIMNKYFPNSKILYIS